MEKLVELLNKAQNDVHLFWHYIWSFEWKYYAKNHWRLIVDNLWYTDEQYEIFDYSDRDICWKDGGFIQRLVENDKIELCPISKDYRIQIDLFWDWTYWELWWEYRILMLLSISDTPIDDLISYLK